MKQNYFSIIKKNGFRFSFLIVHYNNPCLCVFSACPAPIVLVVVSIGGYEAMIMNSTSGKITRM